MQRSKKRGNASEVREQTQKDRGRAQPAVKKGSYRQHICDLRS